MTRSASLGAALLAWYRPEGRDLPWRDDAGDPYRVWVSEVMLQQTRAAAVVPYYRRWLERFPDVRALARAEPDAVLEMWEGLGYYSRARNLHAAARLVCERHGGLVPDDPRALRELPGVGSYTAGAVASIAFGRDEPAVDANARRVLSRVHDLPEATPARLDEFARGWLLPGKAGDVNQALMDLGATVCLPRDPACGECPLRDACRARAAGTVAVRPARRRGPRPPERRHVVAVILGAPEGGDPRDRLALVRRRPPDGLLGGLWEFPTGRVRAPFADAEAAAALAASVGAPADLRPLPGRRPCTERQTYSHFIGVYRVFAFLTDRPFAPADPAACRWLPVGALDGVPMPGVQRRLARREAAITEGPRRPVLRALADSSPGDDGALPDSVSRTPPT